MRVDIWSDIMCPFCYIGKRKLEGALKHFDHADEVEIVWHSYQLDPEMTAQPGKDVYTYLAERKGQSRDWSMQMHRQVVSMAAEAGLEYNFDRAVIANSFDAHRLIQLAKTHGLGDAAEERLFRAYFTEGKDMADHNTLQQIGMEIGLGAVETGEMLSSSAFADAVQQDIQTAGEIGVRGVPFFVIDNRYAVSGAQHEDTFVQALQQAWREQAPTAVATGGTCDIDGNCN